MADLVEPEPRVFSRCCRVGYRCHNHIWGEKRWSVRGDVTIRTQLADDSHQPFNPTKHLLSSNEFRSSHTQQHCPLSGIILDLMPHALSCRPHILRSSFPQKEPEHRKEIGVEIIPGPYSKTGSLGIPTNLPRKRRR
jgi:hypothetical protein